MQDWKLGGNSAEGDWLERPSYPTTHSILNVAILGTCLLLHSLPQKLRSVASLVSTTRIHNMVIYAPAGIQKSTASGNLWGLSSLALTDQSLGLVQTAFWTVLALDFPGNALLWLLVSSWLLLAHAGRTSALGIPILPYPFYFHCSPDTPPP